MIVGIDGIDLDRIGGGQIDTVEFIKLIQKKNHEIKIFSNRDFDVTKMFNLYGIKDVEIIPLNSKLNVPMNSILMHFSLRKNPVDCFIKSNWFIPSKRTPYFNYALFPQNIFFYEKYYSKTSNFRRSWYWVFEIIQEKFLDISGKYSLCNIAQSYFVKKVFWALYKINYNVIYPPVFQEDLYASEKEPNSIVAIGRIAKEKRYDILIQLAKKYPDYNFKIIGGFDYSEDNYLILNEIIENTKKLKNLEVLINTSRKKLVEILSKSQFLIHLMPYEHFGMVIVEALACGTTPIAHQYGGPGEVIEKSIYGNSFRNFQDLLENFNQFLNPKPPPKLMAKAKDFSPENFRKKISKYLYEFLDIVNEKKVRLL